MGAPLSRALAAEAIGAPSPSAALAIGGTIALASLAGGTVSGASLNPARSLGPALVSGGISSVWLYVVARLVSAAAGAVADAFVRRGAPPPERSPDRDA